MSASGVLSSTAEKYLRLHLCAEVGPIRFANLLRELGGIDAALAAGVTQLRGVSQIGEKIAQAIARSRDQIDVAAEIQLAEAHGARIICLADPDYPAGLRAIPDPPPCLYVRGRLDPQDAVALAIVGTRRCSHYGQEQAERFAALTANAGLTIVSGMARGIDTHAHRGALGVGGRTIAVVGCGLCHLYPPEATELALAIAEHGALIGELPMKTAPDAKNFPPRNRIIAGLSLGVLVIEAPLRSGALISARLANEYNREVFAVPGRADMPYAEGCHELIKTGGAKLVTCLPDILQELGEAGAILLKEVDAARQEDSGPARPTISLNEFEQKVLAAFGSQSATIEDLCENTALTPQRVAAVLTGLQLKGIIRRSEDVYEPIRPRR